MNYLRISCAALALALSAQTLFAEPVDEKMVPAPPTLTDEGAQAIKKVFPNVTIGASKLNMDRGIEAWFVNVTGDPSVDTVEVAAGSAQTTVPVMVMQSSLKQEQKDLPEAVAKAADAAAGEGAKFLKAEKLQIFFEFTPKKYDSEGAHYKLVPLSGPTTAYDVTYVNGDGEKGVVRLAPDGTVINPMNWMKHAAAVVPPGKKVIRINLGCVADYTDESGVVWAADRPYNKANGWGTLGGRAHTRVGLVVQGTDAPFIYDSERDKEGAARFDVPNGTYTLRIHFCETWPEASKPGFRLFNINIQGKRVVDKMDITGPAGGWMKPYVKEFPDIQVTDGKLVVEPSGAGNDRHASIEAYEVIQQ